MFENHPLQNPYASHRSVQYSNKGMVATSQPLAANIGLDILKQGGNAIDAAIATAAALTVVEPTGCGIGGDAFAIVWFKNNLYGLNASGHAPQALTSDLVKSKGHDEMPLYEWLPVTVPGCPASWSALSEKFGVLPFSTLLQPAISLAQDGFPVSPTISHLWKLAFNEFKKELKGEASSDWFNTFAPQGRAPFAGEIFRSLGIAKTLKSLADTQCKDFYKGEIADEIDAFSRKTGGLIRKSDLENYQVEWVNPISINYKGYNIWEIPPNGQGVVALMGLNIAKNSQFTERETVETYHQQIEAMKLAYIDGHEHVTQESLMRVTTNDLLSDEYAKRRHSLIGEKALMPQAGDPKAGGTVYLAAADKDGNMVSFIQSNYHGFGSGVVIPGTGIAMQNRGHNFSLNPEHVNYLQSDKKTFHTIIPGFITKGDQAVGPFGVMGGFMQPQGHMQMVMNMTDFSLNPQAALDAPRWQWMGGKKVGLEPSVANFIVQGLRDKGHEVEIATDTSSYGRGQIIIKNPVTGVLCGGTESRTDGHIASW